MTSHYNFELLLNVKQAAVFLGISKSRLDQLRSQGVGPPWVRPSGTPRGAVRYRYSDLKAWLNRHGGGGEAAAG